MWSVDASTHTQSLEGGTIIEPRVDSSGHLPIIETFATLKRLTGNLTGAAQGNDAAMVALHNEYAVENKVQKVVLPKELVEQWLPDGGNLGKLQFGAQTITSDEQYANLQGSVNRLKANYQGLSNAQVHRIKKSDGSEVAIVMGVNAHEFNTIRAAEAKQVELQRTMKAGLSQDSGIAKNPLGLSAEDIAGKVARLAANFPTTQSKQDNEKITPLSVPSSAPLRQKQGMNFG